MKPNLLLLHGALGAQVQLESLAEALSVNFSVHAFDFEGHGNRKTEHPYSIDLFTQNLLDYLTNHQLETVTIFGYSMGGYVALNAALQNHRIKKIITLGTKFHWTRESAQKEVKMLNPEVIEAKVPKFAARLAQLHPAHDWKEVVTKTAQMMLGMGAGQKIQDEAFQNVKIPVILGLGSLDTMVSIEETKKVASLLPNAQWVSVEGIKHPIEQIDINTLIEYILKEF